ncbi:cytoskeleton protein RodZ [Polaromonas sp. OV174]|nr:cytoskeleton protein RodZ [Polaromonas sp. OV174]
MQAGHFGADPAAGVNVDHDVTPGPTAGDLLRQAREAEGLHIAALAAALKVPVKKLEALEQGQFDLLPDAVFARALASSVCRILKLDPAPVLDRLPSVESSKLVTQNRGINAPFRSRGDAQGLSAWAQFSRPVVLAGLVLLLAALVLILLPRIKPGTLSGEAAAEVVTAQTDLSPSPPMAEAGVLPIQAEQAQDSSTAVAGGDVVTVPATSPASAIVQTPVSLALPVAPLVASVVPVNGAATAVNPSERVTPDGIVAFHAKGESWVKVTDAKGLVVLNRTLGAGEQVSVSGALPLTAVVGRADATQVQVRGVAFDLAAFAKNNVARFEVK